MRSEHTRRTVLVLRDSFLVPFIMAVFFVLAAFHASQQAMEPPTEGSAQRSPVQSEATEPRDAEAPWPQPGEEK